MVILAAVFVGEPNAQIAKFFCWLIAKDMNKLWNIFLRIICLFLTMLIDVFLPTELCCAVTTLAVQAYNAVSSDSKIRIKFLASDNRQCDFTQALFRLCSSSAAILNKRGSQNH